jgi:hypothetical protein
MNKQGDKRFDPEFTPTKEATSLLRYPLGVGYHKEPLAYLNQPLRRIEHLL